MIEVSWRESIEENGFTILPKLSSIHELATRIAPVECVVPKGGVVAMKPLIVHASSKSKAETPRKVLHIEYAASDSIAQPLRLAVV